jgi:hypothetical protein
MSTIILDMAVTLSVRNGISALEASRKCAAQIAAIYSARDCDFPGQAASNAAAATNVVVNTALRMPKSGRNACDI